jgi:hypothetical protein
MSKFKIEIGTKDDVASFLSSATLAGNEKAITDFKAEMQSFVNAADEAIKSLQASNDVYAGRLTPNYRRVVYWEFKEACYLLAGVIPDENDELKPTTNRHIVTAQDLQIDYRNAQTKDIKTVVRNDKYKVGGKEVHINLTFVKAKDFVAWAKFTGYEIPEAIERGLLK